MSPLEMFCQNPWRDAAILLLQKRQWDNLSPSPLDALGKFLGTGEVPLGSL